MTAYSTIHISSRAVFDPVRAMSGEPELCLSRGTLARQDGRLCTRELSEIPLRARLLVLSISDAEGTRGQGLLALARSGLLAGADSVILTLWEPPAESSLRFFREFYRLLNSGSTTIVALADARAAIARDPKFRDPVHWAGYVLYGL